MSKSPKKSKIHGWETYPQNKHAACVSTRTNVAPLTKIKRTPRSTYFKPGGLSDVEIEDCDHYGEDKAINMLFARHPIVTEDYCKSVTQWLDKLGEDALKRSPYNKALLAPLIGESVTTSLRKIPKKTTYGR